ncbi:MAG TPA: universal stress protein [Noviherbaspirillum sp.]|uniref:universal stress protein n=1 Tax=Noviherbaspirillum sp. TaxID=1926288 RepID=UPI002B487CB3|nr:universal stress protein [Noviherbaspirillum sp.]HJV84444.1 universal stress protein [Noviherbaspirillum sp.]
MDRPTFAVHINSSRHMPERVRLAAELAVACGAHLVGMASTMLPDSPYMSSIGSEATSLLADYLGRVRSKVNADLDVFERIAMGADVCSCEKRVLDDEAGMAFCLQGLYSDLLIVGQVDADDPLDVPDNLPEYVLMNSGRPVLVCPLASRTTSIGKRCVIAWDGSLEASRAITGALPILRRAASVLLCVVDPEIGRGAHGQEPGADIALYLARHDIRTEVTCTSAGSSRADIGTVLLAEAARFDTDLLVMGGYGHSRLREVVLGGVTATVLRTMNLPVLMAH